MTSKLRGCVLAACLLGALPCLTSCASVWKEGHGGVRYTIKPDKRNHRVEKGADGRLMYDSPELTVIVEDGHLNINGQFAGPVVKGDHVEITDLGTVLVNGQRRGDSLMGRGAPAKKIEHVVR